MLSQRELIHETDFQTLIILDACRFDYFKKQCKIPGKLRKVDSHSRHTYEWLEYTFPDKYPWDYITAHPYIINRYVPGRFDGSQHFNKVHPLFFYLWNNELGTVHPDSVSKYVSVASYDKAIVHYIQPHGPWIGKTKFLNPWTLEQHAKHGVMADFIATQTKPEPMWFRRCYKDNLDLVLNSINKHRKLFKGNIVITADHGEMLGEKGLYLHKVNFPEWANKILREVPWFEVE